MRSPLVPPIHPAACLLLILPQKAPSLITPTFFADRVAGLTAEQSGQLVEALKAGGQLTPEGAQTGLSAFDAAVQQVRCAALAALPTWRLRGSVLLAVQCRQASTGGQPSAFSLQTSDRPAAVPPNATAEQFPWLAADPILREGIISELYVAAGAHSNMGERAWVGGCRPAARVQAPGWCRQAGWLAGGSSVLTLKQPPPSVQLQASTRPLRWRGWSLRGAPTWRSWCSSWCRSGSQR